MPPWAGTRLFVFIIRNFKEPPLTGFRRSSPPGEPISYFRYAMAPLEGSWTRRGLRGGSTGSAPKFMVQIPHRRPEGFAPAGAFRRPTGATPRLLGRRWPPYRVIVRKCRMIYTPVRGTSRTPSTTKIREKVGTKFAGAVSHSTGGVR